MVSWGFEAVDQFKVFEALAAFDVLEDLDDFRVGFVIVEVVELKGAVEGVIADDTISENVLDIGEAEVDIVVETELRDEVGTVGTNQEEEVDHEGRVTKLKAISLEENSRDFFIHLTTSESKIHAAVVAVVLEDLLVLMHGMTTASREMIVFKRVS